MTFSILLFILDTIYLLTAVGLSPGGSTHLYTNNTQNNTKNSETAQITTNVEEGGPCPIFASFTLVICLTAEKKARKNPSQGKKNLSQVTINLIQCTYSYYQSTNTYTNTHITKQYETTTVQINPLNAELNSICHLLALLGAHLILHISRIRVKTNTVQDIPK
jgi:hypothetical protein